MAARNNRKIDSTGTDADQRAVCFYDNGSDVSKPGATRFSTQYMRAVFAIFYNCSCTYKKVIGTLTQISKN